MYDGADTVVLYEELAFQDVLPLIWRPSSVSNAFDRELTASYDDRNLRLLQAWETMDEHIPIEKQKVEDAPYAAEIMRLDLKINLLLDLVGQLLVSNRPRPNAVPVRFNALGAMWRGTGTLPEAGEQGIVEIYLRDSLAEPLRMAGRVTSVTPEGGIKVKFLPMGEAVSDLLEKLAFRRHRRQIAGARQPRR